MRSNRVVVDAPLLDEHLCFSQRVEDFSVEQFIAALDHGDPVAVAKVTAVISCRPIFDVWQPGRWDAGDSV